MKLFNTIAASVAVAVATAGVAHADVNSQLASLQAQVNQLQAQVSNGGSSAAAMVGTNSSLSWAMMSNESGVGKEMNLLQARQNGMNTPVTIGGFIQGDIVYQNTNQAGNFNATPLQGNLFSGAQGTDKKNATQLALSNADLAVTAALGSWVTAYVQSGAANLGQGGADNLSVQDAYAVFGNLAKNPVYGFQSRHLSKTSR